MDWTVGSFGTVGIDSRRLGLIWDWLDSCERTSPDASTRAHGIPCREAAEALKARHIPAPGKHAERVRRPG